MAKHKVGPCPYETVEDLHKHRRRLRGLANCGGAAEEKPTDAEDIAEWHRAYAAEQKAEREMATWVQDAVSSLGQEEFCNP